ncbi:MAG: glucosaminidase domain-containing protein [Bacteroidales bacterium]
MKLPLSAYFILFFAFFPAIIYSQSNYTTPLYINYIARYKHIAVREMNIFHIPASITLAQGLFESGCGQSELAVNANNHFGIKCHKEWTGSTYYMDDDAKQECFRKYTDPEQSYIDHSQFLATRERYTDLFQLEITDYKGWAKGLKKAGYATNPEYAEKLIKIIEANELFKLDRGEEPTITATPANENPSFSFQEGSRYLSGYHQPDVSRFVFVKTGSMGHTVYENEGINFTFAKPGDTFSSIAKEFNIFSFQVYRYNDLYKDDILTPGQIVYLEPKKRQSSLKTHIAGQYDNLYAISQLYGVKLKQLLIYNNWNPDRAIKTGDKVKLAPS